MLVSPHRAKRPWSGQDEKPPTEQLPEYEKECFLCLTNTRISGDENPRITKVLMCSVMISRR
ncbi:hypothetical protein O9992_05115 [Vibrio lentus]|nr:hypothetical protein [Vibrio lentus]